MSTISRLNAKFGHSQIVPVEKVAYHKRSLTSAVNNLIERIDQTLQVLSNITDLRRTKVAECKAPMAIKKRGNLLVKIGYGKRNCTMNKDLSMRAFTSVAEAIDYLNAVKLMLRNGELDYIVQEYIDMLRLRAQLARETAKETDNSLSGDPIVRETVITPAANLKVVK